MAIAALAFFAADAFWRGLAPRAAAASFQIRAILDVSSFSSGEGATVATTSLLLQWTLQKAIHKYRETKDERAREAARLEVMQALESLERARAKK